MIREYKRIESPPYNFVIYTDGSIRISTGGAFIENPSEKLLKEARDLFIEERVKTVHKCAEIMRHIRQRG